MGWKQAKGGYVNLGHRKLGNQLTTQDNTMHAPDMTTYRETNAGNIDAATVAHLSRPRLCSAARRSGQRGAAGSGGTPRWPGRPSGRSRCAGAPVRAVGQGRGGREGERRGASSRPGGETGRQRRMVTAGDQQAGGPPGARGCKGRHPKAAWWGDRAAGTCLTEPEALRQRSSVSQAPSRKKWTLGLPCRPCLSSSAPYGRGRARER